MFSFDFIKQMTIPKKSEWISIYTWDQKSGNQFSDIRRNDIQRVVMSGTRVSLFGRFGCHTIELENTEKTKACYDALHKEVCSDTAYIKYALVCEDCHQEQGYCSCDGDYDGRGKLVAPGRTQY